MPLNRTRHWGRRATNGQLGFIQINASINLTPPVCIPSLAQLEHRHLQGNGFHQNQYQNTFCHTGLESGYMALYSYYRVVEAIPSDNNVSEF